MPVSLLDQISIQLYYFLQSPVSKIAFGVLFVVLMFVGIIATRNHAYHYAMKGSKFGATSALIMFLLMIGFMAYVFVDKVALTEIISGRRPLSELPQLAQATVNRFRFVLGASTDSTETKSSLTVGDILTQAQKLPVDDRRKLELQMCQQLLQQLPTR
jgi:hypothetical protein